MSGAATRSFGLRRRSELSDPAAATCALGGNVGPSAARSFSTHQDAAAADDARRLVDHYDRARMSETGASMSIEAPEVVEEHFLNEPTGVEAEQDDALVEIEHPWQPDQIRVTTKNFSVRNILDMIGEGSLELAPDFQRNAVWKDRQKSRLIESLLLQIPLPAFYFAEDGDGLMRVVDGLQRLSTVRDFAKQDGFRLRDLEYLADVEGQRFLDLPAQWRRRINNTQIVVHVIDPLTRRLVR